MKSLLKLGSIFAVSTILVAIGQSAAIAAEGGVAGVIDAVPAAEVPAAPIVQGDVSSVAPADVDKGATATETVEASTQPIEEAASTGGATVDTSALTETSAPAVEEVAATGDVTGDVSTEAVEELTSKGATTLDATTKEIDEVVATGGATLETSTAAVDEVVANGTATLDAATNALEEEAAHGTAALETTTKAIEETVANGLLEARAQLDTPVADERGSSLLRLAESTAESVQLFPTAPVLTVPSAAAPASPTELGSPATGPQPAPDASGKDSTGPSDSSDGSETTPPRRAASEAGSNSGTVRSSEHAEDGAPAGLVDPYAAPTTAGRETTVNGAAMARMSTGRGHNSIMLRDKTTLWEKIVSPGHVVSGTEVLSTQISNDDDGGESSPNSSGVSLPLTGAQLSMILLLATVLTAAGSLITTSTKPNRIAMA